jgi:hypothetical protein
LGPLVRLEWSKPMSELVRSEPLPSPTHLTRSCPSLATGVTAVIAALIWPSPTTVVLAVCWELLSSLRSTYPLLKFVSLTLSRPYAALLRNKGFGEVRSAGCTPALISVEYVCAPSTPICRLCLLRAGAGRVPRGVLPVPPLGLLCLRRW